ncbi:winged helix-turn-helix domain-containing protein [Frigidibacter sp. RF13]|uniref:winged helix-turn-helix domain-containing protein n=1 Tax=Frigidibacter sp. RF13 TaxID=2997340 RepID=UPI0022713F55|nr:winged helix-turn-helix domain-containing protein [Frigidibacter sp. RF13]MCY1125657.1 winged helix-turn-helix domain-containing protein [Frigidibacter sp. RF13]
MHHVFGPYALYADRAELVGPEGPVRLEPKAFAVLRLLVENNDRVVSREEMIDVVWGGRFISDAAVSTALKFARKAVGDDGGRQTMIRTIHGLGHRFVAPVERRADATTVVQVNEPAPEQTDRRPTIAVLPLVQNAGEAVQVGDGLADEIISSLARLRWLRVIARESTFRFRQDGIDLDGLRRVLGAGYVLSGRIELVSGRLNVGVTLVETLSGSVVWADRFSPALDDLHMARQEITSAVIGALDLRISQAEAATARTKSTEMLDAWGAYHLGMSHLLRFNARDNAIAEGLFARAIQMDPNFSTAFAGRAFALQQEGSQGFSADPAPALAEMRRMAERAVELDPFDPFANMVMGRVLQMSGRPDDGLFWYERAIDISPNFVKGHFSRGMIDMLAGRTDRARLGLDTSMHLSPMDPLLGLMLTFKSLSHLVDGKLDLALDLCRKAVHSNQVHYLILTNAALVNHAAGDLVEARRLAGHLRTLRPDARVAPFFLSMNFANADIRAWAREILNELGIPD